MVIRLPFRDNYAKMQLRLTPPVRIYSLESPKDGGYKCSSYIRGLHALSLLCE